MGEVYRILTDVWEICVQTRLMRIEKGSSPLSKMNIYTHVYYIVLLLPTYTIELPFNPIPPDEYILDTTKL